MGEQIRCPVTIEEKWNANWADVAPWGTSNTKRVVPPHWNKIMMGRGFILVSPIGIGNKDCITTDILSPICDLETKPLNLNIFLKLKDGRCNLCIDEKNSIINFKDRRLLLDECNEHGFKCRHKSKFKLSWLGATETSTRDKNKDIDFGWFLWEIKTFISVIASIISRGGV